MNVHVQKSTLVKIGAVAALAVLAVATRRAYAAMSNRRSAPNGAQVTSPLTTEQKDSLAM